MLYHDFKTRVPKSTGRHHQITRSSSNPPQTDHTSAPTRAQVVPTSIPNPPQSTDPTSTAHRSSHHPQTSPQIGPASSPDNIHLDGSRNRYTALLDKRYHCSASPGGPNLADIGPHLVGKFGRTSVEIKRPLAFGRRLKATFRHVRATFGRCSAIPSKTWSNIRAQIGKTSGPSSGDSGPILGEVGPN